MSLLPCCFRTTISSFTPSLVQCGISPPQRVPQGTESAGHLQTWYDMEPVDHLAGEQSQSPWKNGKNIYSLLSWEQSFQNTETAEDSPYQQSPNRGHLHSDLHRRTRHEGLLPMKQENIGSQERFLYKGESQERQLCTGTRFMYQHFF